MFDEVWLDDWRSAGLLKPSAVKLVLATLEQSMVIRRSGTLLVGDQQALGRALRGILGA